ncbi:hypothetical protein EDB83DRAFT_526744 [Lactarius deliciosus]|nr:hypothetical protein EDB83DRAFT_526744 [Lactarius deliciosus]
MLAKRLSVRFLAFPHSHSCAALATQAQHVTNQGSHLCKVSRRAEACATISDHMQPSNRAGFHVVHCSSSWPHRTCARR